MPQVISKPRVVSIDKKKAVSGSLIFQPNNTNAVVAGFLGTRDIYSLSLAGLGIPANIKMRSVLTTCTFSMEGTPAAPILIGPAVYFYNPTTGELVAVSPNATQIPVRPDQTGAWIVTACFPFYAEENTTIEILLSHSDIATDVAECVFTFFEEQRPAFVIQGLTINNEI